MGDESGGWVRMMKGEQLKEVQLVVLIQPEL